MKKILSVLAITLSCASSFADTTVVCTSADFNADEYNGQSLKLTFSLGKVVAVEKVEGSWYCDSGKINLPKVVDSNRKANIYDVNFNCDETDARLVVPKNMARMQVQYSFSDAESGNLSWKLNCQ